VRNNEKKDPSDVNLINLVEEARKQEEKKKKKNYTQSNVSPETLPTTTKPQSIESTPQKTTTNVPLFQSQGSNEFWF